LEEKYPTQREWYPRITKKTCKKMEVTASLLESIDGKFIRNEEIAPYR